MTNTQIAELATQEACERASRALVNTIDECADANQLTAEQRIILGSSLLREFMGMQECLERMLHTQSVLERFSDGMSSIGDEVEAYLRQFKGPKL